MAMHDDECLSNVPHIIRCATFICIRQVASQSDRASSWGRWLICHRHTVEFDWVTVPQVSWAAAVHTLIRAFTITIITTIIITVLLLLPLLLPLLLLSHYCCLFYTSDSCQFRHGFDTPASRHGVGCARRLHIYIYIHIHNVIYIYI